MKAPKPLLLAVTLALCQFPLLVYAQDGTGSSTTQSSSGKQPITIGEVEKNRSPGAWNGSLDQGSSEACKSERKLSKRPSQHPRV